MYLAKATESDVDTSIDLLHWWRRNASAVPHWAAGARKVLLVHLSASEIVFSLLNASFCGQQDSRTKVFRGIPGCYNTPIVDRKHSVYFIVHLQYNYDAYVCGCVNMFIIYIIYFGALLRIGGEQ